MALLDDRVRRYRTFLSEIGYPRVDVIHGLLGGGNKLFAVRTDLSPAQNHYTYIHPRLIRFAEERGLIEPGRHRIMDTSSSNSGISLAYTAHRLGYPATLIIPMELEESVRVATTRAIQKHGGTAIFPDADIYQDKTYIEACAEQLRREQAKGKEDVFILNHSRAAEAVQSLETIADRLCDEFDQPMHHFVPAVGNGLTILAFGRVLQQRFSTMVHAWEPVTSHVAYDIMSEQSDTHRPFEEFTGLPRLPYRHNIYGTGVRGVRFPFLEAALKGGSVPSILHRLDRSRSNLVHYKPVIHCVNFVVNDFMRRDIEDRIRISDDPTRSLDDESVIPTDDVHDTLLDMGLSVGRSSAASVATAMVVAGNYVDENFLVFFYDSMEKYR